MPKKVRKLPHLFNEVLDAVALLKEPKGSSEKSILNKVDTILHLRQKHLKKSIGSIHRALRYGLQSGLLRLKEGKYRLGMNSFDYKLFRRVQRLRSTDELYKEFRTKRVMRSRKPKTDKKRGGRKQRKKGSDSSSTSESKKGSSDESHKASDNSESESVEAMKGRRRGGRRRGRSRRRKSRRRGRRRSDKLQATIKTKEKVIPRKKTVPEVVSQKSSEESIRTSYLMGPEDAAQKSSNESLNTVEGVSRRISEESVKAVGPFFGQKDKGAPGSLGKTDASQAGPSGRTHTADSGKRCENPGCICNPHEPGPSSQGRSRSEK